MEPSANPAQAQSVHDAAKPDHTDAAPEPAEQDPASEQAKATPPSEATPSIVSPPRRRLRNLLLDARFQLKYTAMVVAVTAAVASLLGWLAYDYSRGQTEAMTIQLAMAPELRPETSESLEAMATAMDRRVASAIIVGIALLSLVLGATGIVITHRVVGPAYRLKAILRSMREGKLDINARLRRGDELQDVFDELENTVKALRQKREVFVQRFDEAMSQTANDPAGAALRERLGKLREQLAEEL